MPESTTQDPNSPKPDERRVPQRLKEELTRPGGLGDHAHGLLRRWSRKVWETRGGGLYAVGFALTFVYLELVQLVTDDIPMLFSINWFSGEMIDFIVQFIVDTMKNTISAFIWPATLVQWRWPAGIITLVVGFALFPVWVKPTLEHWLFEGETPPLTKKEQKKQKKEQRRREKKAKKPSA
ncbi:MAG: hypothetical protein AAGA23_23430 [Pseudomonadota bacterium]